MHETLICPRLACGSEISTFPPKEDAIGIFVRQVIRKINGPVKEEWRSRKKEEIKDVLQVEDVAISLNFFRLRL